jgi:hypothetical protein
MRRRIVLTTVFMLLFSIIFNINSDITVLAASGPTLRFSNVENRDTDIPVNETIVLTFDKEIIFGDGEITLFNTDTFKYEDINTTIKGKVLFIEPERNLKYHTDYFLKLKKGSIVDSSRNPVEKISIYFTTERRSDDEDLEETNAEEGERHGKIFGNLLGATHGRMDFHNGRTNSWKRWLPSDRDITREYGLSKDNSEYSRSFVDAFKEAYKESYIKAFRETNVEGNKIIKEEGVSHGRTIGGLAGETQGRLDYMAGKDNNWRSNLPTDRVLIETYNLTREHAEYMEGFLVGYKEGYREAYIWTFQDENIQISAGNLKTTYVSMQGGIVGSFDGEVRLYVEPGTIYEETAITIAKLNDVGLPMSIYITPATAVYDVRVQNVSRFMDLKKPVTLEFQYYGSESAGIYELKDGKWFYLHSTVEDGGIYTVINANKYSGGTYVVLIDERYEAVDDIGGHWAVKPIETFLKRNYVNGYPDRTFRPEQSITRAEFVKVLDNVYNWDRYMPYIYTSTYFTDSSVFGVFANSISKAASLGYVRGYDDNTFRPHISISYQEVEWLMQRITGRFDFKWDTVAEKILTDYYVRPKSYNSKQNYITRGEVVYLLYLLEEGLI